MIRIIDEVPSPEVVKRTVCRHCGVTIEYTPSDVEKDFSTDYTGGKDYYNFVRCPKCRSEIHVRLY